MSKVEDLRWVRVFTPSHIPVYLVEQVKRRDYSVEDFFKYHESACLRATAEGPTLNPFSHLYVLATPENVTKGFLWFTVDPLAKDLVIQTYSVDKDYWTGNAPVKKLADFIKGIRKKASLNKIYWISDYPKHAERNGFKRSRSILFEYTEENHGENSIQHDKPRGPSESADPRAAVVSDESAGTEPTRCAAGV